MDLKVIHKQHEGVDYKSLYFRMFGVMADCIEVLQKAQAEVEAAYIAPMDRETDRVI